MNQSITIGPPALPALLLVGIAALFLAGFAARWMERRLGVQAHAETHLYGMLAAGLVAARLAYVLQFFRLYRLEPLRILDIRDGGWHVLAGVAAAAAYAAWFALRSAPLRKPLLAGVGTAAAVLAAGSLLLVLLAPSARTLPDLTLRSVEAQDVALTSFRGKPVVVNLWATWCPPCLREMPVLQQAQAERPDVHFVFVNQGEKATRVRDYLAARRMTLKNVLLDEGQALGAGTGNRALPTTFFYDAQGRLVDARVGELSPATLADRLAELDAIQRTGER